jgi:hypothetical protein
MTLQAPNEGDVSSRIVDKLLGHIRQQPDRKGAVYAESPSQLTGGFETLIYAFQLSNVTPQFYGRLWSAYSRNPEVRQKEPGKRRSITP